MNLERIRNFCIIAHVDHGKSTLADRMLELTGTIEARKMRNQFLDMHPLEREKGITIKMQPVRMQWRSRAQGKDRQPYILNLIDTPGHVDFSYEVSRALAAVENAVILVDATQGIQAQTLAHLRVAEEQGLTLIPAVNKIDLPSAAITETIDELAALLHIQQEAILSLSAKTGAGVEELLEAIVALGKAPRTANSESNGSARALIFDSCYDAYQGVIAHVRVFDGVFQKGDRVQFLATGADSDVREVGVFIPERAAVSDLGPGEIGYIVTGVKEPALVRVGDTMVGRGLAALRVASRRGPAIGAPKPLPGYRQPRAMVFTSVFPEQDEAYEWLREALIKLQLNDSALVFEPVSFITALGMGFRAGFLGLLHMEITMERLQREYGLRVIFSNPSVAFRVAQASGEEKIICTAAQMPSVAAGGAIAEPWVRGEVVTPSRFIGALTTLVNAHEGAVQGVTTLSREHVIIVFEAPLRSIIADFYDQVKSVSQGFASLSYEPIGYRSGDLVRMDILVAGERILAFAEIVARAHAQHTARARLEKLKRFLPPELFVITLQAELEGRIIARENIPALRKDVTGYLYGGDRTRKMKLWKKQEKGKKRLKARGRVTVGPEVFMQMLRR